MDEIGHKCGVVAVMDRQGRNVVPDTIRITAGVQHRGELGAGLAWQRVEERRSGTSEVVQRVLKRNGLVRQVLSPYEQSASLTGYAALGHTRYSTSGGDGEDLAQPSSTTDDDENKRFAFAFNGNIVNYQARRSEMEGEGTEFGCDVDTELIRQIFIERIGQGTREELVAAFGALKEILDGAYNIVLMHKTGIYAYRDHRGFRPMAYAEHDGRIGIASENKAITAVWQNAKTFDVQPGELLVVTPEQGIVHEQLHQPERAHCYFEWAYFADRESRLDDRGVSATRYRLGKELAMMDAEIPEDALVVPVPDSAKGAADGYAYQRRMRRVDAILKNPEVGRTFITNVDRKAKAKKKYLIDKQLVRDRDIVLIDDSLVRGVTMKELIKRLRKKGKPKSIHLRLASPPIVSPCFYGIDFATTKELLVRQYCDGRLVDGQLPRAVLDALAEDLDVDTIKYLTPDGVTNALRMEINDLCMACVTRDYPTPEGQRRISLL